MADFTLNGPGTTNNPWTPANVIIPVSTIRSDATGFRAGTTGTNAAFAHDATYGTSITTTATIAQTGASDDVVVGIVARTGGNAGCGIGVLVTATTVAVVTFSKTLVITGVSTNVANTRAVNDVYSVTVSISGGTATVTAKVNGGSNFSFNVNTTTTNAGETTLAAGCVFSPQNNNSTRLSQFTGTGVAVSSQTITPSVGSVTINGLAATINAFTVITIKETFINEAGSPVANRTGMSLLVWYAGSPIGAPDLSYSALTTDAAGTASWNLALGGLAFGQTIFYVATDGGTSLSAYTCARMVPTYA